MKRTVISHDVETAIAVVKFEHNDVVVEDTFNLKKVIPGSEYTFAQMGIEFDEAYQEKALDRLETNIKKMIEDGVIQNPPPVSTPDTQDVETEEEPTEENTNPDA